MTAVCAVGNNPHLHVGLWRGSASRSLMWTNMLRSSLQVCLFVTMNGRKVGGHFRLPSTSSITFSDLAGSACVRKTRRLHRKFPLLSA